MVSNSQKYKKIVFFSCLVAGLVYWAGCQSTSDPKYSTLVAAPTATPQPESIFPDGKEWVFRNDEIVITTGEFLEAIRQLMPIDQISEMSLQNMEPLETFAGDFLASYLVNQEALAEGIEDDSAWQTTRATMLQNLLADEYLAEIAFTDITITDEALRDYFEEHQEAFATPVTYTISRVLVSAEKHGWELAQQRAQTVYEKFQAGEEQTSALIRTYSDLPSAQMFTEFGPFAYGEWLPEVDEIVRQLEVGAWSAPFETHQGYELVYLHSRTEPETPSFYHVLPQIYQHLAREQIAYANQRAIEGLLQEVSVEAYPEYLQMPDPEVEGTTIVARIGDTGTVTLDEFWQAYQRRTQRGLVSPYQILSELAQMKTLQQVARMRGFDQQPEFFRRVHYKLMRARAEEWIEEQVLGEVIVTDEEVLDYFDRNLDNFRTPDRVLMREIVAQTEVQPVLSTRTGLMMSEREPYTKLMHTRERIRTEGVPFMQLAREMSDSPSRYQGGLLDWLVVPDQPRSFQSKLTLTIPGQILEPYRTSPGRWALFYIEDYEKSKWLTFEEGEEVARGLLENERKGLRRQQYLQTILNRSPVDVNDEQLAEIADWLHRNHYRPELFFQCWYSDIQVDTTGS